jgi:transposase
MRGPVDPRALTAVLKALKGASAPSGNVQVLVATKPVDFRKGADGLATLVQESLEADPFSGVVYA